MTQPGQQRIVVGVDSSAAALAALRWAAAEARLRHAALHVVHAWEPVTYRAPYAVPHDWPTAEQERLRALAELAAVVRAAFGSEAPVDVTQELAEGAAERVLIDRSLGAGLLVLGAVAPQSPGQPAGPVVRACMRSARCPLVIISSAVGSLRADAPVAAF
jgi:nucleotide-binding universal stress UspA family protein